MPGPGYDSVEVPPLIQGTTFGRVISAKAFHSSALVAGRNKRGTGW